MSKNPEELRIRMSYRRKTVEELQAIINGEHTDLEKNIASEILSKKEGGEEAAPATESAGVSQEAEGVSEAQGQEEAKPSPKPAPKKKLLNEEEEKRLAEAEAEFDKRQKARKTPSKSDKTMKEAAKEKSVRETKRQVLDASDEIPGLKKGSKVRLKGDESGQEGEIVRLYISSDGKEKCMVKFGDGKPVKKRVSALELL